VKVWPEVTAGRSVGSATARKEFDMSETQTRRLWVAYGPSGAVGTIEKTADDAFSVKMVGAEAAIGVYPDLEVAKNALVSHLKPGSDRPEFREH
jgi:hypothetical protein